MKRKNEFGREQRLALKPLRARDAVVERNADGTAIVKLPMRGFWMFRVPADAKKAFELDEMGLVVWDSCDGRTTLLGVIQNFANHYRLNLREAEVATLKFLQTLSRKHLIGMMTERER